MLQVWLVPFGKLKNFTNVSFIDKFTDCSASGNQCTFPFLFNAKSYNSCAQASNGKPWCATELKSDGSYKNWDYCDENCVVGKSKISPDLFEDFFIT